MLTILINTHAGAPLHHMAHLVRSNPTADIRVVVNHAPAGDRNAWLNCDRAFRDWWLKHGHTVDPDSTVVLLEQDVLVTKPLPDLVFEGVACKEVKQTPEWYWWDKHVSRLPEQLRSHARGLVPMAVVFTHPWVLDNLFHKSCGEVFDIDMICELRVGTLANYLGIEIEEMDMPGVQWHPVNFDFTDPVVRGWGIYHAVKAPVDWERVCP